MKNSNANPMVTVKVASKELNISKGKIKDMINDKKINYTLKNGIYMVNVEEVKKVLLTKKNNFTCRKYYNSVIPKDVTYISRVSDEFKIDGKWMNEIITDIINYWNDAGVHHKVLEYYGTITPIEYRLHPINGFLDTSEFEKLFGTELDDNSMFIWIKQYYDFSMDSINSFDGTFQSHSYKKEFIIGILNPSTQTIKVFDIDTKVLDVEDQISWIDIIKNHTIDTKIIDYKTTSILDIGILSKPIGTAHIIATNNTDVISWKKVS